MPWKARSIVTIRREFVLRALAKEMPFNELCRHYGISRKTGYKYLKRFKESGIEGLADESRRPLHSPLEITAEMSLAVISLRQAHPSWGPRKLHRLLQRRHPAETLPSPRTISRVLERAGLKRTRRKKRPPAMTPTRKPEPIVVAPNDLWTIDFKGWWRARDGARCEPLTVRDAFSRFILDVRLLPSTADEFVRPVLQGLFQKHGVPKAIQSDNGPPFASTALAGLSKLSVWWMAHGISLVRSRPGCPQDNGAHERMHADMRREVQRAGAPTRDAQQTICDEWRAEFNHVRPHEALDMKTPGEIYRPSSRRFVPLIGGFPDGCTLCSVNRAGSIWFEKQPAYVSTVVAGYTVGVCRDGERVFVWFYDLLLGVLTDDEYRTVEPWSPATEPATLPAQSP
jgi:transposase InsO family protein